MRFLPFQQINSVSAHLNKGFQLLARRWVVERTFAWLIKKRRLVVDYEKLPENSECFIYIAMVHLMLKRLGQKAIH